MSVISEKRSAKLRRADVEAIHCNDQTSNISSALDRISELFGDIGRFIPMPNESLQDQWARCWKQITFEKLIEAINLSQYGYVVDAGKSSDVRLLAMRILRSWCQTRHSIAQTALISPLDGSLSTGITLTSSGKQYISVVLRDVSSWPSNQSEATCDQPVASTS